MSIWTNPAAFIATFGGIGTTALGTASKMALSPKNQQACTKMLEGTLTAFDRFSYQLYDQNPCLNSLGMMANGFDGDFLYVLGGVVGLGIGGVLKLISTHT